MSVASDGNSHLSIEGLESAVRAADGAAVLVPPWLLESVIGYDHGTGPAAFSVDERPLYVIRRRRLFELAAREDIPLTDDVRLPTETAGDDTLILLVRPETGDLASIPTARVLHRYWRLLFHGRVEAQVRRAMDPASGAGGRAAVESRIDRVGRAVFNEARFVLQKEKLLPQAADDAEAYARFAATLLELRFFAPAWLPHYFPSAADKQRVLAALADDVDAPALLKHTRPAGAAEPDFGAPPAEEASWARPPARVRSGRPERLLRRAERATAVGNVVRAAIGRMRLAGMYDAEAHAGGTPADSDSANGKASAKAQHAQRLAALARQAALDDLGVLVRRLKSALGFSADEAHEWREALRPLLPGAADGWWSAESRLLYDLQKVCVDNEREIQSLNVVEWLIEGCRRPLRRPLPAQQLVLTCRHLQSALHRLVKVELSGPERHRLEPLLRHAVHEAEHRLRTNFRRPVAKAIETGGLKPENAVERVAEIKLVEELLDTAAHKGFLTLGDLRDSVSRSKLKCHDLESVREYLGHDDLLRIDRRLGDALDDVYHRGEVYRQFFQKLSSLLYANPVGRLLTKTVLLPFLGAYIILEGIDHTVGAIVGKLSGFHPHVNTTGSLLVLGLFLLSVINWPSFRSAASRFFGLFFRGLGWLFVDVPRWLLGHPVIGAVLRSRAVRATGRYVLKPALLAALVWFLMPRPWSVAVRASVVVLVFVLLNVILNSPSGRAFEQSTLHALRLGWVRLVGDMAAAVVRAVVWFFGRIVEAFDRMLYAVDEWSRFRSGQGSGTLVGKALFGIFWFYVAYVIRFCVNLLLEPQVNPIKHFPVVTVSHKLILPLAVTPAPQAVASPLAGPLVRWFGMSIPAANTTAFSIVWAIPGIFGFFAWELKENWKLYRANRPRTLRPVIVGSHGETLARLLRPGFHSGTLPKIFARLRKAHRLAERGDPDAHVALHRQLEALEHVDESVRNFIEREFVALVNQHPAWRPTPVSLDGVRLGATTIAFELQSADAAGTPARVVFEQRNGWIVAGIDEPGWMAEVSGARRELLAVALAGLYKMSAADFVREQVEAAFSPARVRYDFRGKDLVVWPVDRPEAEAAYEMRPDRLVPRFREGAPRADLPALDAKAVIFRRAGIDWAVWVRTWQPTRDAEVPKAAEVLQGITVLPGNEKGPRLAMAVDLAAPRSSDPAPGSSPAAATRG